jgi:hypothetical protein
MKIRIDWGNWSFGPWWGRPFGDPREFRFGLELGPVRIQWVMKR